MLLQVLIVTFVFCLGLTVASILVGRQLLSTYSSPFLRQYFYYLAAFYGFAFYGLWGQVLARGVFASLETDGAAIEVVAGFVPVLGVPFLFVSWVMLLNMGCSMFGKTFRPAWGSVHVFGLAVLAVGAWLGISRLREVAESGVGGLGLIESTALIAAELFYFCIFLALVLRFRDAVEGDKRRVLLTFAGLMFGAFAARSLLAGLVLVHVRLGAVALLAFYASNLGPLMYLRAKAEGVFPPLKAEQATKQGVEHVLDRHGVTKRERQIVEKICLGKTNKQIADELFISLQTVKDHTHRIYSKIGINSRLQLVQLMNAAK